MARYDVVMAGPLARDLVVVGEAEEELTGGGLWYGAFPLLTMGLRVAIVCRLARPDFPHLEPLVEAGADLFPVEAFETTGIRNVYDPSMETRTCTVRGCAAALLPEDLPSLDARVFYAAGLMRGEVPPETLRELARRGPVSVDLQGYLRYRQGTSLPTGPYPGLGEVLALSTWVKADLAEARAATGHEDPERAARALAAHGPAEVIISGGEAVRVLADGRWETAPFAPRSQGGRTGRGDTLLATYVGGRLCGMSARDALRQAAEVTERKVEAPGPYRGPVPAGVRS